jgi:outer membrane receptor protein involved in Fe transport
VITGWRDAYPRLDVRLARPLARDVELALNMENVFDRRPAEWAGFTGRQLTVSLGWNAVLGRASTKD